MRVTLAEDKIQKISLRWFGHVKMKRCTNAQCKGVWKGEV